MHRDSARSSVVDHVELSLPAQPEYLHLARLNVGTVAARMNMRVEDIEDLHLAVQELCLSLLGTSSLPEGRLQIDIDWSEELIEVTCRLTTSTSAILDDGAAGISPEPLSQRILDALVDEHGVTLDDGAPVYWLRKRKLTPAET